VGLVVLIVKGCATVPNPNLDNNSYATASSLFSEAITGIEKHYVEKPIAKDIFFMRLKA
jgi:hypothetical protein